jgi:hypothetical protein
VLPTLAAVPPGPLYRIGWQPDPLAWPDWRYVGRNRFDDPENRIRVLYLAEQRVTCFAEMLAKHYLRDPKLEAALGAMPPAEPGTPVPRITSGTIAPGFFDRPMGALRLEPDQRWLDLRPMANRVALYDLLIEDLDRHGHGEAQLDLSDVTSRDRTLTQRISRWAIDNSYQGIAFTSRLAGEFDCWALFEGAAFIPDPMPPQISREDPDLQRIVGIFDLTMP